MNEWNMRATKYDCYNCVCVIRKNEKKKDVVVVVMVRWNLRWDNENWKVKP